MRSQLDFCWLWGHMCAVEGMGSGGETARRTLEGVRKDEAVGGKVDVRQLPVSTPSGESMAT